MKTPAVYGIKNCNTMQKAFEWLDKRKVSYVFHDYKKEGADKALLERAIKQFGWEGVLNRKGTTWRALPDPVKENMDDRAALKAALENPSLIRRPLVAVGSTLHFGFDEAEFKKLFA